MKVRYFSLVLLTLTFLGACQFTPLGEALSTKPTSGGNHDSEQVQQTNEEMGKQTSSEPKFDVVSLGHTLGLWRGMKLLRFPSDFPPLQYPISATLDSAKKLELAIEEQIFSLENDAEIRQVLVEIADQVEQAYRADARLDYEIEH